MDKLIKKLTLIERVSTSNLNTWWEIYDYVCTNEDCVIETIVNEDYYLYRQDFDLTNKEEWITFDDCRNIEIKIVDGVLHAILSTHDKIHTFFDDDDERRVSKWGITITLPKEFITKFESLIDVKFERFCEIAYDDHLAYMRLHWIKNFKKTMLGE